MVLYNVRIALKSLKRSSMLTAIIVGGITLGITVSTMFSTIRHSFAKDPIPAKSAVLHYVRLDSWDPAHAYVPDHPDVPPTQITYRDMAELMKSDIPVRQSGMFKANLWISADPKVARPEKTLVRMCFAEFFPMFQVPFRYGSGWDRQADAAPEPVVVLSEGENDKLFGGANSVGRTVRIEDRDFKVVGVLGHWSLSIKYYDLTQAYIQPPEAVFIPFNHFLPMKISTAGNSDGWRSAPGTGFEALMASETCWIQFWVELPTASKIAAYKDYLAAYVTEQKKAGRFGRPINNRVTPVLEWMRDQNVVPSQTDAMLIVSLLFLAVCALNLMGLLLGKFLARSAEVGVRRALGARRIDIFLQHLIECEIVGLIGGGLGLLLSLGGLAVINNWMKTVLTRGDLFQLDLPMTATAVLLSLIAGLIAGVYPAWKICRIPPAVHLKVQ